MAKSDLLSTINQNLAIQKGEIAAATVVQVTQLTLTGAFVGDFHIANGGRLIVGNSIGEGSRIIVTPGGWFGYDTDSVRTLAFWAAGTDTNNAGDMMVGKVSGNNLYYNALDGTLGLYSPDGAGFIADSDGSLYAGDTDGAHMRWDTGTKSLQVRNGEDIKISLDANGDGFYDGTVYAQGGRIYGQMAVDGLLRVGDVDGPQIAIGRFSRTNDDGDLVETGEIMATDANNLPWFHVTAGGDTAGGGWFHLGGTGDYAQRLTYDGTSLYVAGAFAGKFTAGAGENIAVIDGDDASWRIYAGSSNPATAPFRVNQTGEVWLDNAHVVGTIELLGEEAGGWTISSDYLAADTGTDETSAGMAPLDYPFYAGATYANRANASYRVTIDGDLIATSATITGAITASSGSITGFLTLGSSGGIYQGSGTAASPTTGLKLWNDGGTGRIAGYNGGTVQWYANTDGKLHAGDGSVWMDSDGVTVQVSTASGGASVNSYKFKTSGGTETTYWRVYDYSSTITSYIRHSSSGAANTNIDTISTGGTANTNLAATYSTNQPTIGLSASSAASTINMRSAELNIDGNSGLGQSAVVTIYGSVKMDGRLAIKDGITAPSTESGYALIYVDTSDGDLKVKFGDGTVKTIATDS